MKNPEVSYTITLDTRRAKKDLTYPVKLRVFHNSVKKRYSTGLNLTKEDFEATYINKPVLKKHKLILKEIKKLEKQISDILDNIRVFSFD